MTGNPEIDNALAELQKTTDNQRRALDELRGLVSGWKRLTAIALGGLVLALIAVGAVAVDMHHSADKRADLRCAETVDRTEAISQAISGSVDDVMDAIADQVAADPDTARTLDAIRTRVDRRLAMRLDQIPQC